MPFKGMHAPSKVGGRVLAPGESSKSAMVELSTMAQGEGSSGAKTNESGRKMYSTARFGAADEGEVRAGLQHDRLHKSMELQNSISVNDAALKEVERKRASLLSDNERLRKSIARLNMVSSGSVRNGSSKASDLQRHSSNISVTLTSLGIDASHDSRMRRGQVSVINSKRATIDSEQVNPYRKSLVKLARQSKHGNELPDAPSRNSYARTSFVAVEKLKTCSYYCARSTANQIRLIVPAVLVSAVTLISLVISSGGLKSIDTLVQTYLHFSSRQLEATIKFDFDVSFSNLYLVSDSIGMDSTDDFAPTSKVWSDLLWLEARDMLNVSAVYFADNMNGDFFGSCIVPDGNGGTTVRIMSKDFQRTNGKFSLYPVNYSYSNGSSEAQDAQKVRQHVKPSFIDKTYDPRVKDWYREAVERMGKPGWSQIYSDVSTGKKMITSSRAVYRATNQTGAFVTHVPKLIGVTGIDFEMDLFHNALRKLETDMCKKWISYGSCVINLFAKDERTDGDSSKSSIKILASSDVQLQSKINNVLNTSELSLSTFFDSASHTDQTVDVDVLAASRVASSHAVDILNKMSNKASDQSSDRTNHYYHFLGKDTVEDGYLTASVKFDDLFEGAALTASFPRSKLYDLTFKGILGSCVLTVFSLLLVAVVIGFRHKIARRRDLSANCMVTSILLIVCFMVITLWTTLVSSKTSSCIKLLTDQMNMEVLKSLRGHLEVSDKINRWNYALAASGGLEVSTFSELASERKDLERAQLQVDATFCDEIRRWPNEGIGTFSSVKSAPSLIYAGSTDGGISGCSDPDLENSGGTLSMTVESLDVSTGTDAFGPLFKSYDAARIDNGQQEGVVDLYARNRSSVTGLVSNFQVQNRTWFKNQLQYPDSSLWTSIYIFANKDLGITSTKGYNLPGSKLFDKNSTRAARSSIVFAVDLKLSYISEILNSTFSSIRNFIPTAVGEIYVVENGGNIIGSSSGVNTVLTSETLEVAGRLKASDVSSQIISTTYKDLVRQTYSSKNTSAFFSKEGEASRIAGFSGIVAEGSDSGRFLISSTRLEHSRGINWTSIVVVSESTFKSSKLVILQTLVVSFGCLLITSFILNACINHLSKKELSGNYGSWSKGNKNDRRNVASLDEECEALPQAMPKLKTTARRGQKTGNTRRKSKSPFMLDPETSEFFDMWESILRAPVENANLVLRHYNSTVCHTEPEIPSILKYTQHLLASHGHEMLHLLSDYDTDGNGKVSFEEFCAAIKSFNWGKGFNPSASDLLLLLKGLVSEKDGQVHYQILLGESGSIRITEPYPSASEKTRALEYIDLVYNKGLKLTYILRFQKSLDMLRLQGYVIFESRSYQVVYAGFILLSLCLAFLEAPASYGNGPRTGFLTKDEIAEYAAIILPINGVCLLVYLLDMCFEVWLLGFRRFSTNYLQVNKPEKGDAPAVGMQDTDSHSQTSVNRNLLKKDIATMRRKSGLDVQKRKPEVATKPLVSLNSGSSVDDLHDNLMEKRRKCCDLFDCETGTLRKTITIRACLLSLLILDFVVRAVTQYHTGPGTLLHGEVSATTTFYEAQQVLFLPYTAVLRPLWLISRYRSVRSTLYVFGKTLIRAKDVIVLFTLIVIIGSICGVILLSGQMEDAYPSRHIQFDNVITGALTVFVFITQAATSEEVVYMSADCDRHNIANSLDGGLKSAGCTRSLLHLYTFIMAFLGSFVVISLIIGVFQYEFSELTRKFALEQRKKRLLGVIAAFILLDKRKKGFLSSVSFWSFVNTTLNTGRLFEIEPGMQISGREWLEFIEEFSHEIDKSRRHRVSSHPKEVRVLPYRLCDLRRVDVPADWNEGKKIVISVPNLVTSSSSVKLDPKNISLANNSETELTKFHYTLPEGTRPGQKQVMAFGLSEMRINPPEGLTFADIDAADLAHWICYYQGKKTFLYDPKGVQQHDLSKDSQIISYARYLAADLCTMNVCIEHAAAHAAGQNSSLLDAETNAFDIGSNLTFELVHSRVTAFMEMHRLRSMIQAYFSGSTHRSIMLLLTLTNMVFLSLYGMGRRFRIKDGWILDVVNVGFLILGFLDVIARLACFGWQNFWYVNDDFFQQCANRFDFRIFCATITFIIISLVDKSHRGQSLWFMPWRDLTNDDFVQNDWTRICLVIPILRVFSTIELIRPVVMGLLSVFPLYIHIFTLLGVTIYMYASMGCMMFTSELKYMSNVEFPDANFNSMLDAIITLLPRGSDMYDSWEVLLNSRKDTRVTIFYVSYTIFCNLVFYNLLIGIVINGYQVINQVSKKKLASGKVSVTEITKSLREGQSEGSRLLLIDYSLDRIVLVKKNISM